MTFTVVGCSSVTIVDDLLTSYLDDADGRTLTLEFYQNCCSTNSTTITLTEDDFDEDGYIFLPSLLGLTTFADGIYNFKLKLAESDGSFEQHVSCAVVMCNLDCDVISYLKTNPDDRVIRSLHYSLKIVNSCDACACEEACDTYKLIISRLKKSNTELNVSTDCGCG